MRDPGAKCHLGLGRLCHGPQRLGVNFTSFSSRATGAKGTKPLTSPVGRVPGTHTAMHTRV